MAKNKDLDKIHEANLHIALQERSGALQRGVLLSEITGRGRVDMDMLAEEGKQYFGPSGAWKVECHHILGRSIPEGFSEAPEIVKEFWPHIPPGCLFLTTAEHQHADRNTKMMKPLLLAWNLLKYPGEIWQGKSYSFWLNQEPFRRWL